MKTFIFALSLFVATSVAVEHIIELEVSWKWQNPDGYWRNVFAINGQFPGPIINVTEGDSVVVRVSNMAPRDSISLHFHGLSMRGSPEMDGAAGFTQLPIPPLQTYTYRFVASDVGTHWYHAHMALQYCDGLYGPFIVNKINDPVRPLYDEEFVAILSDFFHADGVSLGTPRPDEHHWLPYPLINGKGQFDCNSTYEEVRWCSPVERTEFNVKSGRKYRLRLIGAMSRVGFKFSISNHILKVVNRQGLDLQPFETNEIALFPGDRYDVLFEANQQIAEYKIRVQITGCDDCHADGSNKQPNLGYVSWAALRYEGALKWSASEFQLEGTREGGAILQPATYNDARIVPAKPVSPPASSRVWNLNMTSERYWIDGDVAPHRKWFFNGREFAGMMTQTPLLYRVLRGDQFSAETDLLFTANDGDVVDIIFNAQHNQDHPMHLHGYKFWVLGSGRGSWDGRSDRLNFRNPPFIDTINVEGNSWLYLRFIADNPGVWIMHCHLDFHHKEEMAFGFVVAPERLRAQGKVGDVPMCDAYSQVARQYGLSNRSNQERDLGTFPFTTIGFAVVALCAITGAVFLFIWKRRMEANDKSFPRDEESISMVKHDDDHQEKLERESF